MVNDSKKTKSQLIEKLKEIRSKVELLQAKNAKCKQNNNSLREEIEKFNNIVELAKNAIAIVQDSNIQYASERLKELLCCQDEEIEGLPFVDFIVQEELPKIIQISKWRLEGIETLNTYTTILICKDSKSLNVEINAKLIKYKGKLAELLIIRDITERIHIEKTLEQAHLQNKLLLESISLILIGLDSVERVTHWNIFAENTFNIAFADIVGKPFHECDVKWNWNVINKSISECKKENKSVQLFDFRFKSPAKQDGFLNVTITPFGSEYSSHSGSLLLCDDITERKIMENRLKESQKMESIGQLAAGLAHEINTPTQYIGDNTQFIKENFNDIIKVTKEYEKLLNAIKSNSLTPELVSEVEKSTQQIDLEYLIEEIPVAFQQSLEGLDHISEIVLSMKEFTHRNLEDRTAFDINKAIQNVLTITRNEWKYIAEIETDFDPDLPLVSCVSGEINLVLMKVIVNAVDAISDAAGDGTNGKGIIKVVTHSYGDWIEILISDTGAGIPEDDRNRIFEPFYTTKEVGKGTGQGLAVSHSIIKKHQGEITFETEVDKGTVFKIRLPIESLE